MTRFLNILRTLRDWQGLHIAHWFVIALSAVATLVFAQVAERQQHDKHAERFERETDAVINRVSEQLQRNEDVLWSSAGAISARPDAMTAEGWRDWVRALQLPERYPAIRVLADIPQVRDEDLAAFVLKQRQRDPDFSVYPEFQSKLHFPSRYVEPAALTSAPLGLDAAAESHRRHAIQRARDSGQAQITEPIQAGKVEAVGKPRAFLLYVPYYDAPGVPEPGERMDRFRGVIAAPFSLARVMAATDRPRVRYVSFSVADGSDPLYDDHHSKATGYDPEPLYTRSVELEMWGRPWRFEFRSTPAFRRSADHRQGAIILATGLGIDVLLIGLFVALVRANRKTRHTAAQLADTAQELEHKADELERVAYIVAHDLKAPLNGIDMLTGILQDDLEDHADVTATALPSDVPANLGRLHQQVLRMRGLIDSVMREASGAANGDAAESVDTRELVDEIAESLRLAPGELTVGAGMPVLVTSRIQLQQVFENLIGNAFKYHPDRPMARVSVTASREDDLYRFVVTDNGDGIDPRHHESVFVMFETLPESRTAESTGVGLAIVRKVVEAAGGAVSLESTRGNGATFAFTWPANTSATGLGESCAAHAQSGQHADEAFSRAA